MESASVMAFQQLENSAHVKRRHVARYVRTALLEMRGRNEDRGDSLENLHSSSDFSQL